MSLHSSDKNRGIDFSEVIGALSYALDITEGQSLGHAARTCILGMRIAHELGLSSEEAPALFYALLLKDLGCSTNASKVCCLFGADDRVTKADLKTTNWTNTIASAGYVAKHVAPGGSMLEKASRFVAVATGGQRVAKELVKMRCERGADIARSLQLPELTAQAILCLDEHWDGGGHPRGVRGDNIPMLARIMGLAQTAEVFWQKGGVEAAREIAAQRSGTWFDPDVASAFLSACNDSALLAAMGGADPVAEAIKLEPADLVIGADDAALDRVAEGFGRVIDAKSPWTFCHSSGVAEIATAIGRELDISGARLNNLRRAALLHDIGKLGVSNLILDKPGKLNDDELAQMRRHPGYTYEILSRVQGFRDFADMAASHHEKLNGRGYHRGLSGSQLTLEIRILAVSDMFEALAAKRPYRKDLTREETLTIIDRDTGEGLCPTVVAALKSWLSHSNFTPYQIAA